MIANRLVDLKNQYRRQLADRAQRETTQEKTQSSETPPQSLLAATDEIEPVNAERREKGEYHYYQPVYFRESCLDCHSKSDHSPHSLDLDDPVLRQLPAFRVIHANLESSGVARANLMQIQHFKTHQNGVRTPKFLASERIATRSISIELPDRFLCFQTIIPVR